MRKVVASTIVSLDGVQGNPQNWSHHFWDEEHGQKASEILFAADALLMGRLTYEGFVASWPKRSGDPFTDRINAMPKYVASRTLKAPLEWNSTLIQGDLVEAVAGLKQQDGGDILLYGCGEVAHELVKNGLLDELKLWVNPVIAGDDDHLFHGASDLPLMDLQGTDALKSGIVILTYNPRAAGG